MYLCFFFNERPMVILQQHGIKAEESLFQVRKDELQTIRSEIKQGKFDVI